MPCYDPGPSDRHTRRADEEAERLQAIREAGEAWAKLTPSEQAALRKAFGK